MLLETRKHLFDVQYAAGAVVRFIGQRSEAEYLADEMVRSAVERQFAIIGEAMTRLVRQDRATAERITEYQRIVAFRNQLVHAYDHIDHEVVYRIMRVKLPILVNEVTALLAEPDEPPPA